jgi:putative PIN family toxin of toxin-antitoxin system
VKLVVVFDTSVLLSAVGWGGKPGQCVQFAREGHIEGVTCVEILGELAGKLTAKLGFTDQEVIDVIGALQLFLRPVAITGTMKGLCADAKDDMVLECALAASATHVVSGDKRHLLALEKFRGIPIVSPAELERVVQSATP